MLVSERAFSNERIAQIDILRGFAVCGIFLVNVPDMVGGGHALRSSFTGSDAWARLLYDMFVQTKFYTIFAFLFGASFHLFMQKAESAGKRPAPLFARRLTVLFVFGIAHAVLLWFGDVLYSYAALGFLLLPFNRRPAGNALIWSIGLLGFYSLLMMQTASDGSSDGGPLFAHIPDMSERLDYLLRNGAANIVWISSEIFGLFLLGLHAGRKGWFTKSGGLFIAAVKRIQWTALLATVLLFVPMVRFFVSGPVYKPDLVYPYTYFTGKTMAVFYVCTLLRLMQRFGTERFRGLAYVGRMAFTNYLTQTIVTMGLMWTFPQMTEWPMWAETVYCCALLAVQFGWSRLWLERFRLGPLEWIWRAGTYGTLPALRKSRTPGAERDVKAHL